MIGWIRWFKVLIDLACSSRLGGYPLNSHAPLFVWTQMWGSRDACSCFHSWCAVLSLQTGSTQNKLGTSASVWVCSLPFSSSCSSGYPTVAMTTQISLHLPQSLHPCFTTSWLHLPFSRCHSQTHWCSGAHDEEILWYVYVCVCAVVCVGGCVGVNVRCWTILRSVS